MARVALVSGGTRGIGAAIAAALKDAGYEVAANYGGNDEAASAFKDRTGIPVYKWDVAGLPGMPGRDRQGRGASSGRSTCWSTTPASPATPPCTG